MKFDKWYDWLIDLPPLLRWFPILIVLRPVIDNFYFLKEASPLLSPPYIVGALTPVLCVAALVKYRHPARRNVDKAFVPWAVMILINCVFLLIGDPFSLMTLEFILKLSLPVYLFFFLRVFITSRRDLDGLLTSFLLSGIFVAVLLLYEIVVRPISVQESRGLERIQGSFGDVVSYGMYIVFTLIAATYFFVLHRKSGTHFRKTALVIVVGIVGFLGLLNIHHTATYTVFLLVLFLFVLQNFQSGSPVLAFLIIVAFGVVMDFAGSEIIEEKITPLVQTDLMVYSGEAETDRLLHGRVGRWRMMLNMFSQEPVWVQFFGYPLKFDYVFHFIGIGSHNDFVRMLFATGIAGLLAYLGFIGTVFRQLPKLTPHGRYLLLTAFLALILYSISVTPTMYAPFMYFIMSVFAFSALPAEKSTA